MFSICIRVVVLLPLVFNIQLVNAQNWNELFRQKKTQRKYLIDQVAGLQVYLSYAKRGYDVVKDGATLVGDVRRADFDLHCGYFNSLKVVGPAIQDADEVKEVRRMHLEIERSRDAGLRLISKNREVLGDLQVREVKGVYSKLLGEADKIVERLNLLLENGKLEMTDDERLTGIGVLYEAMKRKYSDCLRFGKSLQALIESRKRHLKELEVLKRLYE